MWDCAFFCEDACCFVSAPAAGEQVGEPLLLSTASSAFVLCAGHLPTRPDTLRSHFLPQFSHLKNGGWGGGVLVGP